MIRGDYHTHHFRCGHAKGSIEEYIQAAIRLGLAEIGISDHSPLYWQEGDHPWPGSAMAMSHFPDYIDEVLTLKRKYAGKIRVLLSMEADFLPGHVERYRELVTDCPFDYVIGSVHYCDGLHIYNQQRWRGGADPEATYREYFRLIRESARSGLFDVLGHITGLMAYGPRPSTALLDKEFDETVHTLAETGVAIELNASGIRKGGDHPFPCAPLLRRCIEAGVPLTYGSDSHLPSEVGHAREVVATLLKDARRWEPPAE